MKQKLLFLLVLLLTATTGAWAQSAFTAKEITSASQLTSTDDQAYVAACMPSDFLAVDADVAKAWTGAPTNGSAILIYAIDGNKIKMATFLNGDNKATTGATWSIATFKDQLTNSRFFYTAATYSVTLAEGTEDATNWTISPAEAAEGSPVTATYNGEKKVKSVKAVKKAAGNAYLKWNADQKKLVATEIPTTATKVENSNAGVEWQAGTYVVEGEDVKINGGITLNGTVDLIIKDGAKLTAQKIIGKSNNLSIYGQAQMTGELVVNSETDNAIKSITTFEVHSAKVTSTSSGSNRGGFDYIGTINVYGGEVDAKNTAEDGGYGIGLKAGGFMNIYGGEVKAEGKGDNTKSNGINGSDPVDKATVTVYGGKLWAGNADDKALRYVTLTIDKSLGFNGEIETSPDNSTWNPTVGTPDAKYVRVGY